MQKCTYIIIMMVALLWLTVSLPFVFETQQKLKAQLEFSTNTTEEKSESGSSIISEYLHEPHPLVHIEPVMVKMYKCHSNDPYFEHHPEIVSPPPEMVNS